MTERVSRLAVIPSHNRPDELNRLLAALRDQCDIAIVIDNASTPPLKPKAPGSIVHLMYDDEQPPNLSRLWNVGLDEARRMVEAWDLLDADGAYDVAVFNDDAVPPPGWWDAVSGAMRRYGAAAGCSDPHGLDWADRVKVDADPDIMTRMTGWAFMLRGELGLRADERYRWWWGDTDLDWRARRAGGMVVVPGFPVGNTLANSTTVGVLAEQAGRDRQTFIDVWGYAPW